METLISTTWNNWLAVAFIAPMLWAIVNMMDVYFVADIYKDEWEGIIISDLFQILPWFILFFLIKAKVPFFAINDVDGIIVDRAVMMSLLGGFLFSAGFYFYFKSLRIHNDVALVQILWNLCIAVVPILAFILFDEILPIKKYLGMFLTLLGATVLSFNQTLRKKASGKFFLSMIGAIFLLSLSMVLENKAYGILGKNFTDKDAFLIGFFYFSLGAFLCGLFFIWIARKNPIPLIKKYFVIFFIAEGVSFMGTLASQRALNITPSASYVATVENFIPAFVMVYSLFILIIRVFLKSNNVSRSKLYKNQLGNFKLKLLAILIMALGVYIIN